MDLDHDLSTTPVGVALSALSSALDGLIDVVEGGGLDDLAVMGVLEAVRGFERVRNRMALVDHQIVSDCDRRQIPDELNLRTTRTMLVHVLHLSFVDAGRRVRGAAAVGQRTTMTGAPLAPLRPVLAAAQRAGEMTPEQLCVAEEALRAMDTLGVTPEKMTAAEQSLADHSRAFDPRHLTRIAEKLLEAAAPDGPPPNDDIAQQRRRLRMSTGRDGAVRGTFCLTPDVGAALTAVLSPLATPRKDPPNEGGHLADAHHDSRTSEQRLHDALGDLCSWALRGASPHTTIETTTTTRTTDSTTPTGTATDSDTASSDNEAAPSGDDSAPPHTARADSDASPPANQAAENETAADSEEQNMAPEQTVASEQRPTPRQLRPPGVPATVIVTIDINDLINRTGTAETSFGSILNPEQLVRLAGEADIYPTVLTATGVPLTLGRTRRIASRAQTIALNARDAGCSFPGCDHPPEWCDRHHIISWIDGGLTDLNNLTLLCRYHHTRFLNKGWTCHINTDGIPAWTPPPWQDHTQTPIVNLRILRHQLQRRIADKSRGATQKLHRMSLVTVESGDEEGTRATPNESAGTCSAPANDPDARAPWWIEREQELSAAASARGNLLGPLWCPGEGEDLLDRAWTAEEIWEAGWRPVDPHPERLVQG